MDYMKIVSMLIVYICLFSACGIKTPDENLPDNTPVAAWIGDQSIPQKELEVVLRIFMADRDMELPKTEEEFNLIIKNCLRDMAETLILFQEAKKRHLQIEALDLDPETFGIGTDELPEGFEALSDDRKVWIERVKKRFTSMEIASIIARDLSKGIEISDEEIQLYYTEQEKLFIVPMEMEVRVIRVFDPDLALDIHKKLLRGWSFIKLAENYSNLRGDGARGKIIRKSISDFPPEFTSELEALKPRKTSPILTNGEGYFTFRIERQYPEHILPFDEVRDTLREELMSRERSKRFRNWLNDQVSKTDIRIGTPVPLPGE